MENKTFTHNIILFGESGSGKSSIVNMLVGKDVAESSNGAGGCTFKNDCYETRLGSTDFRIYDTAGLNEGDQGRVPHLKAIEGLYTLIRELDGVSLLVFCMRGRAKENTGANWILFNRIICAEKVPIIAVVTGLEDEEDLDDWWKRDENKKTFKAYHIKPRDVACVVSIRGRRDEYVEKYRQSQQSLQRIILESYRRKPWSVEKDKWVAHIYQEVYTTRICFLPHTRLEFAYAVGQEVDNMCNETGMMGEDAETLKASLLHAEKKFRKNLKNKIHK